MPSQTELRNDQVLALQQIWVEVTDQVGAYLMCDICRDQGRAHRVHQLPWQFTPRELVDFTYNHLASHAVIHTHNEPQDDPE